MKIDYDERRKNDETFILNLTPGDFELEGTRKIANNRQIKFVLKKHKETYLMFTIVGNGEWLLEQASYRNTSNPKERTINISQDKSKEILKEVWIRFFNFHKTNKKMNSVKIINIYLK